MTFMLLFDELRFVFAVTILFAGFPWLLAQTERTPLSRCIWTMRTVLFAEVASIALGTRRLLLPGAFFAALALFLLISLWLTGRLRGFSLQRRFQGAMRLLFNAAENSGACIRRRILKYVVLRTRIFLTWRPSRRELPFLWMAIIGFSVLYPLHQTRFLSSVSYSRVLSLQVLTHAQAWTPDGSVSFLAPIVFLSGDDAATVIRIANPMFIAALAAAAWFAIWELTASATGASLLAIAIFGIAVFPRIGGELEAGGIASIAWLVAIGLLNRSLKDAANAAALALLIQPSLRKETVLYVGGVLCAMVILWIGRSLPCRYATTWSGLAIIPISALAWFGMPAQGGPYQHESAAQVADRIARTFPQKQWLIVSPVQELAFTYGRGWHYELSEFTGAYRVPEVSRPDFGFAFPVKTVFVFTEKQPLRSEAASDSRLFNATFDPAMRSYESYLNRAGMEYQASAIMAAYASTHAGVDVFFEDDVLRVYRLECKP